MHRTRQLPGASSGCIDRLGKRNIRRNPRDRRGALDRLFASVYYLRPVADFRNEAAVALPKAEAAKLIALCQTNSSPRMSFETAMPKTA